MRYIIGICDDEELMLKINELYVREMSKKIGIDVEILCFRSGNEIIEYSQSDKIDVAFMDIDMKGISGINAALKLKSINRDMVIIFVTGHREFAIDAFEADAVGYLVKPIQPEKVEKMLRKSINLIILMKNRVNNTMLVITEDNIKKKIPQYKIIYIEKEGNQCQIHTTEGTHSYYIAITKIIEELEDYFWQINQGIIINKKFIKDIVKNEILLKNGLSFILGRKYSKEIRQKFFQEKV